MLAMDGNTAPYLQYAFARIRAILRKADEAGVPGAEHNVVIEAAAEVSLAKSLLRFSSVMELVSRELKPHHLCTFLYEIATAFSSFYENCPVLQSDEPTRGSRLLLCGLTARVLSTGLDLLGIDHPERM
jgi:arginyl-tRNA synthetase